MEKENEGAIEREDNVTTVSVGRCDFVFPICNATKQFCAGILLSVDFRCARAGKNDNSTIPKTWIKLHKRKANNLLTIRRQFIYALWVKYSHSFSMLTMLPWVKRHTWGTGMGQSERVKMGIEKEVGIQKRQTERWKKDEIFGFCFTYKAINSNAFCDYINFSKLYVHFVDFPRNNFSKWLKLLRWLLVAATTVVVAADIACYDIRWYHAVHGFFTVMWFFGSSKNHKMLTH